MEYGMARMTCWHGICGSWSTWELEHWQLAPMGIGAPGMCIWSPGESGLHMEHRGTRAPGHVYMEPRGIGTPGHMHMEPRGIGALGHVHMEPKEIWALGHMHMEYKGIGALGLMHMEPM